MKKKLFAGVLVAVMTAALLPTMAFAEPEGQEDPVETKEVTSYSVNVEEPEVGEALSILVVQASNPDESVIADDITWYKVLGSEYNIGGKTVWTEIENLEEEEVSTDYIYSVSVRAKVQEGYALAEKIAVTLNDTELSKIEGDEEEGYKVDDGYITLTKSFNVSAETKYVTKLWTIISVPQVGKTLDYAPQADIEPQGGIAIQGVTWYKALKETVGTDDEAWEVVEEGEVADAKYLYAPMVECKLGENYELADDVSIKLNDVVLSDDDEEDASYVESNGMVLMTDVYEPLAADTPATTETTTADGNPKTGDNNSMILWIALMAAGAAGVAFAGKKKFSGR